MVTRRLLSYELALIYPASMQWHDACEAGCTLRCRELSASVPGCIASCVPTLNTLRAHPQPL
jgi:hypothetical protein